MKTIFHTTILFFFSSTLMASNHKNYDDTTKIETKNKIILIISKDNADSLNIKNNEVDSTFKNDEDTKPYLSPIFEIGMNGYLTPDNKMTLPPSQNLLELNYQKSRSISFSFMLREANIIKDRLYISPGIGYATNSYEFKNNVEITTESIQTEFIQDSIISYDQLKLRTSYIQVPLILGLRLGNTDKTPVGIQVGAIGNYKVNSKLKQKYFLPTIDTKLKNKIKDDFNINPFKIDLVTRISIGDVGIYAKYALTTLFEKNKAPELYPFSIGFTFGGF